MPNRATHQLPEITELQDGDLVYIVRDNSGTYTDHKMEALRIGPALREATVQLNSASVQGLGTEVQLVAAQGAGKHIIPQYVRAELSSVTTPYATNTTVYVGQAGAVGSSDRWSSFPIDSGSDIVLMTCGPDGDAFQMGPNAALAMKAAGNPTAGDGTLTVTVGYIVVE